MEKEECYVVSVERESYFKFSRWRKELTSWYGFPPKSIYHTSRTFFALEMFLPR
jgi:hypothetical protein